MKFAGKSKSWGLAALWLIALVTALGCETTQTVDPPPTAATPVVAPQAGDEVITFFPYRGMLTARVHINGKDVGFFIIDTGASLSAIDRTVADKLNLPVVQRGNITGIGGRFTTDIVSFDSFATGDVALPARRAAVIDFAPMSRSMRWPIKGIIGWDNLRDRPVTFDYARNTLTLHDPKTFKPADSSHEAPLHLVGRIPAVPARVGDNRPIQVIIDTGANGWMFVPSDYVRRTPGVIAQGVNTQSHSRGVGGVITDVRAEVKELHVFGLALRGVQVSIEYPPKDQPEAATRHARFGNQFLQSFTLTLNYPKRKAWARFTPAKKKK